MRPLTDKLGVRYRRLNGGYVLGFVAAVPTDSQDVSKQYRTLLIRKPTHVRVGEVLFTPGGDGLILTDHANSYDWAKTFRVLHVSRALEWKRPVKIIDPVSRVQKDNGYTPMGLLYANLDSGHVLSFEHMAETKYKFVTGQDVRVDDVVGGKTVKRIAESYGVKLVEAI